MLISVVFSGALTGGKAFADIDSDDSEPESNHIDFDAEIDDALRQLAAGPDLENDIKADRIVPKPLPQPTPDAETTPGSGGPYQYSRPGMQPQSAAVQQGVKRRYSDRGNLC